VILSFPEQNPEGKNQISVTGVDGLKLPKITVIFFYTAA